MGKIDLHPNENIIKAALINNYAHINSKPFVVCSELTISEESKIVDLVFCKATRMKSKHGMMICADYQPN